MNQSHLSSFNPESVEQRLSRIDKQSKYLKRGIPYGNNIIAVLHNKNRGFHEWKTKTFYGKNIVTDDGDIYYAQKSVGETPAVNEDFGNGRLELQNPGTQDTPAKSDTYTNVNTPITGSRQTFDVSYPVRNDSDTDNTGAGPDVVTYRVSYTAASFAANGINGGAIHDNASPVSATKLLTHFTITPFEKTVSDTLKMFVNHTKNGV